jgi:beta-N-acetylhexosaminidase
MQHIRSRAALGIASLALVGAVVLPASTPAGATTTSRASEVFASMTRSERVGQLLMIGCPSTTVSATCLSIIRARHVGSVILDGNSTLSIAEEHTITAALQHAAPAHRQLLIATDQEGGLVRRMRGPGFTDYSTALVQGTWYTSSLEHWATGWGTQLKRAGINVNLAPVLDTVAAGNTNNPPIGDLDREYGHTVSRVTTKGLAVARGLTAGGVLPTVKHFPGLGRVTKNPDTSSGVTDRITTSTSAYLQPFAAAVTAKVPFVMMSTAVYPRLGSTNPAAFSGTIVTKLLRGTLGFKGVVVSDDLGAAKQVAAYSVGSRATRFLGAGGDLILTVKASQAGTMIDAILARMHSSTAYTAKVYAAVHRVLKAKAAAGLLD